MKDSSSRRKERILYHTLKRFYLLTTLFLLLVLLGLTIFFILSGKKDQEKLSEANRKLEFLASENASLRESLSDTESYTYEEQEETKETEDSDDPLTSDPRYSVISSYENIGIIKNVNNYLNIRKEPSSDSISIGKAMKNSAFNVVEETDGWYLIESEGMRGYVSKEYVATGDEGVIVSMEKCTNNAFAREPAAKVYESASDDSAVVFEANPENGYAVLDVIGTWVKVRIAEGLQGYMHKDDVDLRYTLKAPFFYSTGEEISETRLNIINFAFEWYGGDYVWGGDTLGEGVDCSGFTLRVYEHFGINMPRLSIEQSKWGTEVSSMEEAKPGDLLFFHGYFTTGITEDVGHVAIYLGNGKMIHAASKARGIVMDNYNYLEEPMYIRRVIND